MLLPPPTPTRKRSAPRSPPLPTRASSPTLLVAPVRVAAGERKLFDSAEYFSTSPSKRGAGLVGKTVFNEALLEIERLNMERKPSLLSMERGAYVVKKRASAAQTGMEHMDTDDGRESDEDEEDDDEYDNHDDIAGVVRFKPYAVTAVREHDDDEQQSGGEEMKQPELGASNRGSRQTPAASFDVLMDPISSSSSSSSSSSKRENDCISDDDDDDDNNNNNKEDGYDVSASMATHRPRRNSMEEFLVEESEYETAKHAILEKRGLKRWDSAEFYGSPDQFRRMLATQAKEVWRGALERGEAEHLKLQPSRPRRSSLSVSSTRGDDNNDDLACA